MSKWIITAAVLIAIVIGAILSLDTPRTVETATARRTHVAQYVEERAKTRVPTTHTVSTPFEGRVLPIVIIEGTTVTRGDAVAHMDTTDLDHRIADLQARVDEIDARITESDDERLERTLIEQARAVVDSVDHTVAAAEDKIRASQANADYFADQLKRKTEAFESGALTKTELDLSRVDQISADVDLKKDVLTLRATEAIRVAVAIVPHFVEQFIDKKALNRAILNQQRAQAAAQLQLALDDHERADIEAPVGGVVAARLVSSKTYLPAGTSLLEIARPQDLEVEIEMLTSDAATVSLGDTAEIFGDAIGPDPISATVSRIYPRAFKKISSLGVEQQRVLVILKPNQEDLAALTRHHRTLGLEYRVRTRVFTDRANDAIVIPRAALFRAENAQWTVFLIRAGRARKTAVEVGLLNDDSAQITRGLAEGDKVIIAPPSDLQPNDRVTTP